MDSLPNFLYIGAAKAGSSWLYSVLSEHPEVYIPFGKRTYFFDRYYDRGMDWYRSHFKTAPQQRAVGEICHSYFLSAETASRIRADLPDVKLICCLRNPLDRLVSAYLYEREHTAQGRLSFSDFADQNTVLQKSDYAENLLPFFELFPREQILVLFYDDLCADAGAFYSRICRFLEIDPTFVPEVLDKRVWATRRARFPFLTRLAWAYADARPERAAKESTKGRLAFLKLLDRILYTDQKPQVPLDPAVIDRLRSRFLGAYAELERCIGRPVPDAWRR
jgi:hypothetical protein